MNKTTSANHSSRLILSYIDQLELLLQKCLHRKCTKMIVNERIEWIQLGSCVRATVTCTIGHRRHW